MRIFVEPAALAAGELAIRGDEHHYLAYVRRARSGDAVELVDGAGRRAAATIARIGETETVVTAGPPEQISAAAPLVRALLPLIKGDRMDGCLEKLVEVGADAIVVWPAARSVVRLDDARRDSRLARYQSIAKAAARQSGRAQVPLVAIADSLTQAIAGLPELHRGQRLMLDPASDAALADAAPGISPGMLDEVTIVSGPEGGLAPGELDLLAGRGGFVPLGLGPRVLRADTAPVVAVALIRAATRS